LPLFATIKKLETHPFLKSEFSIIKGEKEEFIPYPSQEKK